MRITHVVENLNRGGLERVVIDLVAEQVRRGHNVQVLCLFEEGALAHEIKSMKVPIISCEKRRGPDISAVRKLRSAIRRHDSQVVHSHNAMCHYYAVAASVFMRARRINTRHGMADYPFLLRQEIFYRLSTAFSHVCAVVCDRARSNFIRYHIIPKSKAITVYNGIPLGRFVQKNADARKRLLAEIGLNDDVLILGSVGRLSLVKDHESLLAAMPLILKQIPSLRLVLVGGGALHNKLLDLSEKLNLSGKVFLLGDRSDVRDLLPAFDIFALSSITEGYSIALVEACACRLPIVSTNVGGNSEIVIDESGGFLVPPRDPQAFAQSVVKLAMNADLRLQMGAFNRRHAEAVGSIEAMADQYDNLYGESDLSGNQPGGRR